MLVFILDLQFSDSNDGVDGESTEDEDDGWDEGRGTDRNRRSTKRHSAGGHFALPDDNDDVNDDIFVGPSTVKVELVAMAKEVPADEAGAQ